MAAALPGPAPARRLSSARPPGRPGLQPLPQPGPSGVGAGLPPQMLRPRLSVWAHGWHSGGTRRPTVETRRLSTFWRGLSPTCGRCESGVDHLLPPPASASHWTLDFDLSLSTRPGPLMVLAKYLKVAGPAPSFPPTSSPSPHTTTILAPLPHDRLDPPSCQLVSILHHRPMDCVSKEGRGRASKGQNEKRLRRARAQPGPNRSSVAHTESLVLLGAPEWYPGSL